MARYMVTYYVRGTVTDVIDADSKEAAEAQAEDRADGDEWDFDNGTDVDFEVRELHRVIRNGDVVWVNYIRPRDVLASAGAS